MKTGQISIGYVRKYHTNQNGNFNANKLSSFLLDKTVKLLCEKEIGSKERWTLEDFDLKAVLVHSVNISALTKRINCFTSCFRVHRNEWNFCNAWKVGIENERNSKRFQNESFCLGDNARREKVMGVKKMPSRTTFEYCQFQLIVYCFSMFSVAL